MLYGPFRVIEDCGAQRIEEHRVRIAERRVRIVVHGVRRDCGEIVD